MVRVFVVGALIAGGIVMLAPGASASVPASSKTCKSLESLDKVLNKVVTSSNYDSGTINNLSKSFRKAAKTAPKACRKGLALGPGCSRGSAVASSLGAEGETPVTLSERFSGSNISP